MPELLLELLCEEIPARMQAKACDDLKKAVLDAFASHSVAAETINAYATPRRLVLHATGLPVATPDVRDERKGPRADAPEQAIAGFLKSTGLRRDQLEERVDAKGVATLFAMIDRPGQSLPGLLVQMMPPLLRAFPWPKSMRWGERSRGMDALRWVRPLQSILCLFDGAVVPVELDGIKAGNVTRGHRFMGGSLFSVADFDDYRTKLRLNKVILDSAERMRAIETQAKKAADAAGLTLVDDAGLLAENAGLTEWPVVLMGSFDPAFLDVPAECLTATMRANQKYFTLRDSAGAMANRFLCVANLEPSDGGKAIIAGNEKVLSARLSDAKFFWDTDLKTPLAQRLPKLADIVFHEKLGTLAQKVERVAALAKQLAAFIPGCEAALAEQAARLAKADLVSAMVGEFPELQGIMGRYYATREGLDPAVAQAIEDHYKPLGQGDACPTAPVSVAVALADKMDTLVSFFAINEKPTGSKDPFALRRAALAVIRLITENRLRLGLGSWLGSAQSDLLDFFADRLKVQQREAGVRHDLIDAVFALGGEDDLVRLLARVAALQAFVASEDGANLLAGYKRAANILKIEEKKDARRYAEAVEPALLALPQEIKLYEAVEGARATAAAAVATEDFAAAMAALAQLRAPVDAFFEAVTVNAPEPHIRANRLNLLSAIRTAVHTVADFSRIEG